MYMIYKRERGERERGEREKYTGGEIEERGGIELQTSNTERGRESWGYTQRIHSRSTYKVELKLEIVNI